MTERMFRVNGISKGNECPGSWRFQKADKHEPQPRVPTRQDLSVCALQTGYSGIVCSVCLSDCEYCLEEIARGSM